MSIAKPIYLLVLTGYLLIGCNTNEVENSCCQEKEDLKEKLNEQVNINDESKDAAADLLLKIGAYTKLKEEFLSTENWDKDDLNNILDRINDGVDDFLRTVDKLHGNEFVTGNWKYIDSLQNELRAVHSDESVPPIPVKVYHPFLI
jgi:hypothetical protein